MYKVRDAEHCPIWMMLFLRNRKKDSWHWVQEEMYTCLKLTKRHYPNLPYILLGLSPGSFIARSFLITHPGEVDGVVLEGTGQSPAWQQSFGTYNAKLEGKIAG